MKATGHSAGGRAAAIKTDLLIPLLASARDTTDTTTVSTGQPIDIQVTNDGSGASAGIGGWGVGCAPN